MPGNYWTIHTCTFLRVSSSQRDGQSGALLPWSTTHSSQELGQADAACSPTYFSLSISVSTSTSIGRPVDTPSLLIGLQHAHLML
jgi:hypothetical protein